MADDAVTTKSGAMKRPTPKPPRPPKDPSAPKRSRPSGGGSGGGSSKRGKNISEQSTAAAVESGTGDSSRAGRETPDNEGESEVPVKADPSVGTRVVVIHLGSISLRIGTFQHVLSPPDGRSSSLVCVCMPSHTQALSRMRVDDPAAYSQRINFGTQHTVPLVTQAFRRMWRLWLCPMSLHTVTPSQPHRCSPRRGGEYHSRKLWRGQSWEEPNYLSVGR